MASLTVVPAILTNDPAVYQQQMANYLQFTKRIQLDITDGEFTPTVTIPLKGLTFPQGAEIDLHVMMLRPSEHVQDIIAARPSLVILHAEATEPILPVLEQIKGAGIKTGVALLEPTFPERVRAYIEVVDHVMIFAGTIGQQGSSADLLQIEKIPLVRAIKSDVEIGWDGGANMKTIRALGHADLNVINVGSALATAQDPAATYAELAKEAERRGVAL